VKDQSDYLAAAADDENKLDTLRAQWGEACSSNNTIHCADCGLRRHLMLTFRCLYCGVWFCGNCAERHFSDAAVPIKFKEHSEEARQ
jgi:hypothetical protein